MPGSLLPLIERPGLSDLLLGSVDVLHPEDMQPFPECPRHPPVAFGMYLLLRNGAAPHGHTDAGMILQPFLIGST